MTGATETGGAPRRNRSLRVKLGRALTFAAVALLLGVAAVGTALAVVSERQTDVTDVYYRVITQGDLGLQRIDAAHTAVRAYAATGNEVVREPFDRLSDDARQPEELRGLDAGALLEERFGADHPALVARQDALEAAVRWYQDFAVPTVERTSAQGPGAVPESDLAQGQVLYEDLLADAELYLTALRAERNEARDDLVRWLTVLTVLLVLLVVAALGAGLLLWVLLRRWVTDPLAALAADARHVADGDVERRVTATGPGEVGDVAADVEAMRVKLAGLVAEATAARAEIESSHQLLQEQAEDLRRSNRDLEQFAYVASHDLQEPLRKIASFTQLLAKRYAGQLDERADQYIYFAVDGAKRMQRLINDLLSFSRVGRIGGEVGDVDMGAALEQVRSDLGEAIEETGATVVAEDLPVVRGEEPLLVQLLQNLVGNAVKFRHPDREPLVRITAEREGDCWEFACEDNGIGIDPQYAERVFVIFQRLHPKDVYEGTGIGLALCKKIVDYHGGHIWIDTAVTEGTRIRWSLPADPEVAPHLPEADATSTPPMVAAGGRKDG
ncbi:MAG: HAMP domain-containing protein [Actinotalea sp.]|nr:HAMP domain-containing protein [Actinotalea sp.]